MKRITRHLGALLVSLALLAFVPRAPAAELGRTTAAESWVTKLGMDAAVPPVRLWVYRKRLDDGRKNKPLLFLVRGSAMALVQRTTGQAKAAFFGQSSGALRAARFASVHPEHVDRLVVDAFVWTGKDAPTLAQRAKTLPELLKSNTRKVDAKFYRSVFTRDHPGAASR